MKNCQLRMTRKHYDALHQHMYPGDGDEHGAVLLAGLSNIAGKPMLHVREVHLANDGTDYVAGKIGYRALTPQFIHRLITRARDERLVYLAVHNHGSDLSVGFSEIDLASHERGYPALLQISKGMPVGAVVLGKRSMQVDLWNTSHERFALEKATIVGRTITHLTSSLKAGVLMPSIEYERQLRMFGQLGQAKLSLCKVAIIGLGGIGSLMAEYLARLGVGQFVLVDPDCIDDTNLSRVVGATVEDVLRGTPKVAIANRNILQAQPKARVDMIQDDVAKASVAGLLIGCDYIFLAADSMRARLIFNAIVHQYIVPGVQLGAKVRTGSSGELLEAMSVNRPVRPGQGCLWCNQLIDTHQLAKEAKSDEERKQQAYGVDEPNPSVITLNAVSAAHAANDFLLDFLGLRKEAGAVEYEHFHHLRDVRSLVQPRVDVTCPECSAISGRLGRGDGAALPCST